MTLLAIARDHLPDKDWWLGLPRRPLLRKWVKRLVTVVVLLFVALAAYDRRSELASASHLLGHVQAGWMTLAAILEVASMVVFARLQRWLLLAGGVRVGIGPMVEITLAGNALGTSLPGGAAWSTTWAFGQLHRRGADRFLAGWVLLVSGGLASFAVFVILAAGAWIAGSKGPVAPLRGLALALAAVPVLVAAGSVAAARWPPFRLAMRRSWAVARDRIPGAARVGRGVAGLVRRLEAVKPGLLGWFDAFSLALLNWLTDLGCLVSCMLALRVPVPWRGLLVVYGLTQISASLPITPGGLGVVEGSMAALLVAYGMHTPDALAVVLLYRIVSFWALVPIGWGAWFAIDWAERTGHRRQPHPWAWHHHGLVPHPHRRPVGPEVVREPRPCEGCQDEEAA